MCLVTLGCGFPSFHFCNLWVTQKPLPGGFPWKGLWQHLLRMGGLCDSLSQCLLCVTFCPQSQGPDSHCSFWPCTVSGLGFEKPHSLSAASTWGCLGPFLSYSDESMRSYFMQGPASFNSCTTRKGSPKWPFCGGFNSTGPLMTWGCWQVDLLWSCQCTWHRERLVKCCWCEWRHHPYLCSLRIIYSLSVNFADT